MTTDIDAHVEAVNREGEWGTYSPVLRIEIERGPWDAISVAGYGPGVIPPEQKSGWFLVQRAKPSPHPMTWHSARYPSSDAAWDAVQWLEFERRSPGSRAQALKIPGVHDLAFAYHHSPYGCKGVGSLLECRNGAVCIQEGIRNVRLVLGHADVTIRMLEAIRQ